jgi:hypothetical protein
MMRTIWPGHMANETGPGMFILWPTGSGDGTRRLAAVAFFADGFLSTTCPRGDRDSHRLLEPAWLGSACSRVEHHRPLLRGLLITVGPV